jgi:hypothetical protein
MLSLKTNNILVCLASRYVGMFEAAHSDSMQPQTYWVVKCIFMFSYVVRWYV